MSHWDPKIYARFEAERQRPAEDLIKRIPPRRFPRIVDLGCGGGLSTTALQRCFPDAQLLGLDNSEAMLAAARQRLPHLRFELGDIATWSDPQADIVFSNAALHWAPRHIDVMARIAAQLPPQGVLAAQFPDNLEEPSHILMRQIAARPEFVRHYPSLDGGREAIGAFADYDAALAPHCSHIDIWRTVYVHRLDNPQAIVDWVEGAGLRPYLQPLAPDERQHFLALYLQELTAAYPPQPLGGVLLLFPRLFVVAAKQG